MVTGICHLCGEHRRLTYEHVPPKKAFNWDRVRRYELNAATLSQVIEHITVGSETRPRSDVGQKGVGDYTLCERCNNDTGSWYGTHFVNWAVQAMEILVQSGGHPPVHYRYRIRPLAVLKQIIAMFFSVNSNGFHTNHPELRRFVLDRERQYLSPLYRVYGYYNLTPVSRSTGSTVRYNVYSGATNVFSEFAFPPFGFVLAFQDTNPPDSRVEDISYFSHYEYHDEVEATVRFPILPVISPLPGDHRTGDELVTKISSNPAPTN